MKVTRLGPPPIEDFCPEQMMEKKLKTFKAWHASIPADYAYSYADELIKYAKQDTKLLMHALLAFRKNMREITGWCPLLSSLTIASFTQFVS